MKQWMFVALIGLNVGLGTSLSVPAQTVLPIVPAAQPDAIAEVSIVGAVKAPGRYQLSATNWLVALQQKVDPPKVDFGQPVTIQRGGATLTVNLLEALGGSRATLPDVVLQDGDVITVPMRTGKISLLDLTKGREGDSVLKRDLLPLPEGETLSLREALSRAGYNPLSHPDWLYKIQVLRGAQTLTVDLAGGADKETDFMLCAGDHVIISRDWLKQVSITGHVKSHGTFYFPRDRAPTIAEVVQMAGGFDSKKNDLVISLIHMSSKDLKPTIEFDSTLEPDDPRWQQKVEDFDILTVFPRRNSAPNQAFPNARLWWLNSN